MAEQNRGHPNDGGGHGKEHDLRSSSKVLLARFNVKDNVNEMTSIDWERILAIDVSDKGLLSKTYKEF